jgi:hypothetical protein
MDPIKKSVPVNSDFASALSEEPPTFLGELWQFVRATGKWWLLPVLFALLLLGAVAVLSATCYAPFIYTLF